MQNNLLQVLDIATPKIKLMVDSFINHNKDNDRPITQFDIEMYELGITIDLIKAFGRYVRITDFVSDVTIGSNKGVIVIYCNVTRDAIKYFMETEMIIAGGHNIQVRHYRYITKTKLSANSNNVAALELIAKQKRLTKSQLIKKDIERNDNYYNRRLSEFNALKALTQEEVYAKHSLTLWSWEGLNDGGKKNYESKEKFDLWLQTEKDNVWAYHLLRISDKALNAINKEYKKAKNKLEYKLLQVSPKLTNNGTEI